MTATCAHPAFYRVLTGAVRTRRDESGNVRLGAVKEYFDRMYGKCEAMKDPPAWLSDEKIIELLG